MIALLRSEAPQHQLIQDAYSNLQDFLKERELYGNLLLAVLTEMDAYLTSLVLDTKQLVDEVFVALEARSYLPDYIPPPAMGPISYSALPKPTRSSVAVEPHGAPLNGFQGPRKRSYSGRGGNDADSHYLQEDRQIKQPRTAGRGRGDTFRGKIGRGGDLPGLGDVNYTGKHDIPAHFPNFPLEEPLNMPFYPNDTFAAMAAFQAMGLPVPQLPQADNWGPSGPGRDRCIDYDTVGFCAKGSACTYQHDTNHVVVPAQDEYDPKNAVLMDTSTFPTTNGHGMSRGSARSHQLGSGRGQGDRGGLNTRRNNRAEFSHAGPNHDRSITTIVVEQIPEEKFDEQSVQEFFSQFGSVQKVTMQPYKRLALVEYDGYLSARKAYESPKVIFDNRFVKVYWYKPGALSKPHSTVGRSAGTPSVTTSEEQPFDREDFERRAREAQMKLEEKKAQVKDMEVKRQMLEKQKEELAEKQASEKKRLMQKLAARTAGGNTAEMTDDSTNGNHKDDATMSASTKLLRAKLAELEAEAKSLGLDQSPNDPYAPRGRGRGRGRGSYRGWERIARPISHDSYRGSQRGGGAFRGYGGGRYNLDLRTKKVGVSGVDWTNERDEALRQHLLVSLFLRKAMSLKETNVKLAGRR